VLKRLLKGSGINGKGATRKKPKGLTTEKHEEQQKAKRFMYWFSPAR